MLRRRAYIPRFISEQNSKINISLFSFKGKHCAVKLPHSLDQSAGSSTAKRLFLARVNLDMYIIDIYVHVHTYIHINSTKIVINGTYFD